MNHLGCRTCGWQVNAHAQEVVGTLDWEGRAYHFCSFRCREKFEAQPTSPMGVESERLVA